MIIDFTKKQPLNESWLKMIGTWSKSLLKYMYGDGVQVIAGVGKPTITSLVKEEGDEEKMDSPKFIIRGEHKDVKAYAQAIVREKEYIDEDTYKSLPEVLPKPNFRLLLNCYSGFGKDVIISNLLLRKDMFDITNKEKPFIDYFILVSPTARNDPSQIEMLKWADEYYENFTPQIFNDIKELQDSKRDEYDSDSEDEEEPFQILLYINDLIGDKTLGRELDLFLPKMRHSNVNLILSRQALKTKTTSPIVRSNMTHLICSKVMSEKQLASLDEEYTGSFGGKFRELYNYATAGRYDFLFLDLKKRIAHRKYLKEMKMIMEITLISSMMKMMNVNKQTLLYLISVYIYFIKYSIIIFMMMMII